MGGAGAALTGGNFWQGAATGIIVIGLNHAMHEIDPPGKKKTQNEIDKENGWTNSEFKLLYEFNEFCLDAYGFVRAAELSAVKWAGFTAGVKGFFTLGSKNVMAEGKLANHLFKGAGKLADTPANRTLITNLSNGKSLGVDAFGKSWYAKSFYGPRGNVMQVYSYVQDGLIKGAGINSTPVNIIKRYGLK